MRRRLGVALVHYPVSDRQGRQVATSITNLDIHDIARSAYTFGAEAYYLVHPVAAQRELVSHVLRYWLQGPGGRKTPDRVAPLAQTKPVVTLEEARLEMGADCELWVSSARPHSDALPLDQARARLEESGPPVLLLLGTGYGLSEEIMEGAHCRLEPIGSGRTDGYNHLSVRAAAAILLAKLSGAC